ncbi:MAG: hypothetical protein IKR26_04635 [Lachnospiraceae bacterium]|nr:hypothetical protein [Lachnospiraceae bacterium]
MFIRASVNHFIKCNSELRVMSRRVAKKYGVCRLRVALDAMICCTVYGTIYTEYEAMDFLHRSRENRKTYVTVFWLIRQLAKYNDAEQGKIFRDKRRFNSMFAPFVRRQYLNLDKTPEDEVERFIKNNKKVVMKSSGGCSGKQVHVISTEGMTVGDFLKYAREHSYDLTEVVIENCEEIKRLNPTSLNTIRIVTVHSENVFRVMVACLRIGAVGADVDNVSSGGTVARIDKETGKLDTTFRVNAFRQLPGSQAGRDEIGMQIPYWNEAVEMIKEASKVLDKIHVIGWDVAITPDGPILIEGNESFNTASMELYYDNTQPGLTAEFEEAFALIDKDIYQQ